MIDFEEARNLALAQWSEASYCMEYDDAYVFGKPNDKGGHEPVVVLKDSGRCVSMVDYLGMPGNPSLIRESCIRHFPRS